MLNKLIGKKVGMTSIFVDDGSFVSVTVIEVGPCFVTQVKTMEKDGVNAVQLGFDVDKKPVSMPLAGHFKKANVAPVRIMKEFKLLETPKFNLGDVIKVDMFEGTKKIDVIGTCKGRGFQGVIKRFNKASGPKSHGSMNVRTTGSRGSSAWPSRTLPNCMAPGHMGDSRVTTKNIEIVKIDAENNLLLIKGSVPGYSGSYVVVRKSENQKLKGRGPKPAELKKDKKQPTASKAGAKKH